MGKHLFRGGYIVGVDPEKGVVENGYLLVDDGVIAEVGEGNSGPVASVDQVTDLGGAVVMPGLVNAHGHSYSNLVKGSRENLPLEVWMLYVAAEGRAMSPEDARVSAMLGSIEMLKGGVTCFLDHLSQPPAALLQAARAYGEAGMRALVTPMFGDKPYFDTLPGSSRETSGGAGNEEEVAKGVLEGVEGVLDALKSGDDLVTGGVGPSGPQRCSDSLLVGSYELAEAYDVPWHTHLLETRIQKETARDFYGGSMVRHLDELGLLSPRCSLAHAVWTDEEDAEILARSGATVVHNPVSNLLLGSGVMPLVRMREAGVAVALGTDGVNCSGFHSMFESMKLAAILSNTFTEDYSRWIEAKEILGMGTSRGAAALGMEKTIGRLKAGAQADFVVLKARTSNFVPLNDLLWQLVYGRPDGAVSSVYVGGKKVVDDGVLLTLDEDSVYEEALERGRFLMERVGGEEAVLRADRRKLELLLAGI